MDAASCSSLGMARKNGRMIDDRDREPERRLRQGDAERVAEQADLAQHDEQRQDRDGDGNSSPSVNRP